MDLPALSDPLGLHLAREALSPAHMALRAIVCYGLLLLLVRLSNRRFLTRGTAIDVVLAIVLGSVASRAITGNAPFVPTLTAAAVLVALHEVLAALTYRSHRVGMLLKGNPLLLMRHGEIVEHAMRHSHTTRGDLAEALREHGVADLGEVEEAWLERSGYISVIRADAAARKEAAEPPAPDQPRR
ncbi:MAG TPA: YetF domain-containing protein [Thermoanaerobaculia bacterium]|jgi:uncharacterized membrane protein YcaP (DUF421 family)|nr:YetF domain-containing protein [Thermoanaerobaculia bacterium]